MTRRLIAVLIWGCLVVTLTCARTPGAARQAQQEEARGPSPKPQAAATRPPADPHKFAIIICGASGEEAYAKQFAQWASSLRRALTERLSFAEDRMKVLWEKPVDGAATAQATAVEVRRAFESLRGAVKPDDALFIFFIGHGTFDGRQAKFNLVGPDLNANDYNSLIAELAAQRVLVFNMTSAPAIWRPSTRSSMTTAMGSATRRQKAATARWRARPISIP